MNKKRYVLSLLITILGIISLISGTSYAILNGSVNSSNTQVIRVGKIKIQLTEKFDNITTSIYALEDTEGLIVADKYDFSVTNIGSAPAKYDVKLVNIAPDGQQLSDEYVKIGLKVNGKEMGPMKLSSINNIIDTNVVNKDEIIRYEMRVWFDKASESTIASQTGKKVILKLKVEAEQSNEKYLSTYPEYSWSTTAIPVGTMLTAGTYNGYCVTTTGYDSCTDDHLGFLDQNNCKDYIKLLENPVGYTCTSGSWTTTSLNGTTEDYTTLNKTYFIRHNFNKEDDSIESNEICFIMGGNLYCIKGDKEEYELNKQILQEAFTTSNCNETNANNEKVYICATNGITAEIHSSKNTVVVHDNVNQCNSTAEKASCGARP